MKRFQLFFQCQGIHFSLLLFLLVGLLTVIQDKSFLVGELWGFPTVIWFWLAVFVPILHQTYVWLCWRLELYYGVLSRVFKQKAFSIYSVIFFGVLVSRLIFICLLACANQGTVVYPRRFVLVVITLLGVPMGYVYYSIVKYFGLQRAAGLDHFDLAYRHAPLIKEGVFKHFRNPIYLFGLFILFIPGLIFSSKAAFLVAVFQYIYIWVHYLCTEKPDMQVIYGAK